MLKTLYRTVVLITLVGTMVCVILLLNFTAPNPTGRRYSSAMPLRWDDAEQVLADDLGLPNNNRSQQRQCACPTLRAAANSTCNSCFVMSPDLTTTRMPDVVGPRFLADSKFNIMSMYRIDVQLQEFALAARQSERSLWIYVPVTAQVHPTVFTLVQATGGDVVYYFTVPGWVDPIDQQATFGLLAFGGVLLVLIYGRIRFRPRRLNPAATTPPNRPQREAPIDSLEKHVQRIADRAKARIYKADFYEDRD